ncbi:MAG: Txe/YoeB family addiction module toxin [Synergistaceae bacterium]|nr:Txe/YoeB family addiction module toxin [Synergistaceae bacterium]
MRKLWSDSAWEDYVCWQDEDKKTLRKINALLKSIDRNGYACKGHPEQLTGNLSGFYSVRIDKENRIVFRIINEIIEIFQCASHYGDK